MRFGRCLFASMNQHKKSGDATRDVLRFTFRHWRAEPRYVALIVVTMMVSTLADVFMPVFAGTARRCHRGRRRPGRSAACGADRIRLS